MFKTTFSLDKECFYFLFQIALIELQNGKGILNLNQTLKSSIKFVMDNIERIDLKKFEIQHVIKTDKNNYIMYFNGEEAVRDFLIDLTNQLSEICNFELKNNQIIKSIVMFHYNNLVEMTNQNL